MEFYALFMLLVTLVFSNFLAISKGEIHPPSLWKLAVYWPNSWCRTASVNCSLNQLPDNQFLIRTMYKVDENDTPLYCDTKPPMDRSQLAGVMDLLPVYWPDSNGDNYGNWEFSWQRQASCFGVDPYTYFLNAIGMKHVAEQFINKNLGYTFNGEKFYGVLFASSFYPSNYYRPADISSAFSYQYGFSADLRCNEDDFGINQLLEFHLCAETIGTINELQDCSRVPKIDGCTKYTRYT